MLVSCALGNLFAGAVRGLNCEAAWGFSTAAAALYGHIQVMLLLGLEWGCPPYWIPVVFLYIELRNINHPQKYLGRFGTS